MARTRKTVLGNNPFDAKQAQAGTIDQTDDSQRPRTDRKKKSDGPRKTSEKTKTSTKTVASPTPPKPTKKRSKPNKTSPDKLGNDKATKPRTAKTTRTSPKEKTSDITESQPVISARTIDTSNSPSLEHEVNPWDRESPKDPSLSDGFGYDPDLDTCVFPWFERFYERYFRVQVDGAQHIPAQGPALIVANHSGVFPYDELMLKTAVRRALPLREYRWLTEEHRFHMPLLGSWLIRMGAVRACQRNAEDLLQKNYLVATFPEGIEGSGRLFKNRRKLQPFVRNGFLRLSVRTKTPIVPCILVGAEESMPLLFKSKALGKLFGVPFVPITPTFPWLGALGMIPAPTKWHFVFGEPIVFEEHGDQAAEDDNLIKRLENRVQTVMQTMLDQTSRRTRRLA